MADLPPSAEAATTEGVAQAEAETIELSPLSTPSIPRANAAQQRSGNSPSSGSNQSRRTSATWTIVRLPSISIFYSLGYKSWDLLGRYKTSIYKNVVKVLGVFCGLGALTLAWIALRKSNDTGIQSLAAMNRSYKALQESLSKLQEELANERAQLETDRELLRNEADQLDLQKWTAQRQFIKDCLEYHEKYNITSIKCTNAIKVWDEPPPSWSETTFAQVVRRRPMIPSTNLDISQTPLMTVVTLGLVAQSRAMTGVAHYVRVTTSQESPGPSPKEQPPPTDSDTLPNSQIRYLDRSLTHFMMGFITFIAVSLILVYMVRLLRRKASAKQTVFSRSEKTQSAEILPHDVYPAVIRNTATSGDLPVGNRNRRATSAQYRKGDIWTAAYSGSLEAIACFRAENRYTNINEISPRLGTPLQAACQGGQLETAKTVEMGCGSKYSWRTLQDVPRCSSTFWKL